MLRRRIGNVGSSLRLGSILFSMIVILCLFGTIRLPLDVLESETELKNLPPARSYLSFDKNLLGSNIKDIQSGIAYTTALLNDGRVRAWGDAPEGLTVLQNIIEIAAGYYHVLALDINGKVRGYGKNRYGETVLPEGLHTKRIKNVYAGNEVSAVLSEEGEVFIWGNTSTFVREVPDVYQTHIIDVSIGAYHIALLMDDSSVRILGNQGAEIANIPASLQHGDVKLQDIQINASYGVALSESGDLYGWGEEIDRSFLAHTNIVQIAASSRAIYALDKFGTLYSYGVDLDKEAMYPKQVYRRIFADTYQMYGIDDNGALHAWGNRGFLLGSDAYGRDIATRLVHGGLTTLWIGFIACIIELFLGVFLGMYAGYYGGWVDHILMRLVEVVAAIPLLPLVITLSAFMKDSFDSTIRMVMIMVLLGILSAPHLARMVRSIILVEKEKEYVVSTKVLGASTAWIMLHELLPQITYIVMVNITLSYADNILIESSLSFLGFGVEPPYPTWGNMLEGAQSTYVLEHNWWQWVFPAFCIFMCVFSVNLIGEGLRKRFDPKESEK